MGANMVHWEADDEGLCTGYGLKQRQTHTEK